MKTSIKNLVNCFGLASLVLTVAFCSGCGTITNHPDETSVFYPGRLAYGGVKMDWYMGTRMYPLGCGPWWFLDMPFSAVFDTLCFPYDSYYLHRENQRAKAYQEFLKHAPLILPDPLAAWKSVEWVNIHAFPFDNAIAEDYKAYFKTIPSQEQDGLVPDNFDMVELFEDGHGSHAVKIKLPYDGIWWNYDLFYDQNNQRIRTVKYAAGYYRKK